MTTNKNILLLTMKTKKKKKKTMSKTAISYTINVQISKIVTANGDSQNQCTTNLL
jgi:hypothetical protein